MAPIVSIIIPSYNYGHYLAETLRKLLEQPFDRWECIVVDDGSTDNTRDIVGPFSEQDSRIRYHYQRNQGLSAARNTGIGLSRGNYVQLLDADDLLSPSKLMLQAAYMDSHPEISVTYTDAFYFLSDNPSVRHRSMTISAVGALALSDEPWIPRLAPDQPELLLNQLFSSNIAPVNSMLVRKSVFNEVGAFDTSYKRLEDWNFWTRAAIQRQRFAFFDHPDAYALVRVHGDSMSFDKLQMDLYYLKLLNDARRLLKTIGHLKVLPAKRIERVGRSILRQYGMTNRQTLTFFARQVGWAKTWLWCLKELNAMRKSSGIS